MGTGTNAGFDSRTAFAAGLTDDCSDDAALVYLPTPRSKESVRAERLLETAIYGPDLDLLEQFYVELLGLEPIARTPGRNVVLRCGSAALILFDPAASGAPGGPFPPHDGRGRGHIAFAIPLGAFPAWRARLEAAGVAIEREVNWPDGNSSLYFRDPAGNSVELAPPTLWDGLGYRAAEGIQ